MSPVRRDLFTNGSVAHSGLQGTVTAERFVDGTLMRVAAPITDLRLQLTKPGVDRQILHGHPVRQLEADQGLSRDETNGYVGYVSPRTLATWSKPTHRVTARMTFLFTEPDFKSPHPEPVSCGSNLTIVGQEGKYSRTIDGSYAVTDHLTPIKRQQPDLAATAKTLLGTPYLWGGNSAFGIDCSGLIQIAAQAAGLPCPGDSDQQMAQMGHDLPQGTPSQRNDLMFWKGHVALAFDDTTIIHANAHHMAVAFENIQDALQRIERQDDGPMLAHKRL